MRAGTVPKSFTDASQANAHTGGICGTIARMAIPTTPIHQLVLNQLATGEKRLLVLVVSVRRSLGPSESIKGDLSVMVKAALRKLVASKVVIDEEGVYSLMPKTPVPELELPRAAVVARVRRR
jgi:hypothetical protein